MVCMPMQGQTRTSIQASLEPRAGSETMLSLFASARSCPSHRRTCLGVGVLPVRRLWPVHRAAGRLRPGGGVRCPRLALPSHWGRSPHTTEASPGRRENPANPTGSSPGERKGSGLERHPLRAALTWHALKRGQPSLPLTSWAFKRQHEREPGIWSRILSGHHRSKMLFVVFTWRA